MTASVTNRLMRMARMRPHMSMMKTIEAGGRIMPEMVTFVPNKGPTIATGIIEVIIIAPIAVIVWAIIAIVITVIVHGSIRTHA
jgi:hypothetical protein